MNIAGEEFDLNTPENKVGHKLYNKMKKLFLFGLAVTLFVSCKDEMTSSPVIEQTNWETFGSANADGAKFISDFIQDQIPENGRISQEESTELIITATDEYLKLEGVSEEDRQSTSTFLHDMLTSKDEPYYDGEVTEMQASFIAALELAFQQEADFETTISYIEGLEEQAYDLLTDEEIFLVLMATTTAKSQATFWHDNLENSSSNGRVMCVTSWRNVGVKAISGAFAGATACGFGRFLGPVGWKAWGVCIVGGVGAVADIVEQCLAPKQTTIQNCVRYSSGNLAACGRFLNYGSLTYGRNPYRLLNLPIRSFP